MTGARAAETHLDLHNEVDSQVLKLSDGKKALPTQAITMPAGPVQEGAELLRRSSNRTITVGGSTLGIKSLGFKLVGRNYVEARQRLGRD